MKPRKPSRPARRASRAELETSLKGARAQLDDRRSGLELKALRRDQQAIEASRELYAELYDFAPIGYLTFDPNGLIRTLNLTAAALLGRPRDHLIGRPFRVLVSARDRRRFLKDLSRLRRGETHVTTELNLHPVNGVPVAVQMVTVVHTTDRPHAIEYHTALVDITERRRAAERTAALAKLGLLLGAAADPAAAARAVVDTAQEYCGWDACFLLLHDPATDSVTDLVNMDTIQGQRVPVEPMLRGRPPSPLIRRVLTEGPQLILRRGPDEQGPLTTRFGDTSRVSLSLMFVPVRQQEGRSIGVLSVQSYQRDVYTFEDLAALQVLADAVAGTLARLQAQAELQAAHERLQQEVAQRRLAEAMLLSLTEDLKRSNLDLEQFAYVASHDLQEPLRAVGGYVRLLQQRFPQSVDAKAREYIEGAAEGAIRMEQLITDLLAYSRAGGPASELAPTDLGTVVNATLHNLQLSIRAAKAVVTCDPLPTLKIEPSQIGQLFQNLIANALKFRSERPLEIHIGAREEPGRWVLWVRDNGIGLDPEFGERIFQVFQRLHTRKKYPGTGIGLAICKKIVKRHGGDIWVESQPGQGATFYFSLPAESAILPKSA